MKKTIAIILIILILLNVFSMNLISAQAVENLFGKTGDCSWFFDNSTGELTISGNGAMEDYCDITADEDGWEDWLYYKPLLEYRENVYSIIIETGVNRIGAASFSHFRNVKNISISNSVVEIADGAFEHCESLKTIFIPNSVKEIGKNVFYGCTNLFEIVVDSNNPYYSSEEGILYNKNHNELIRYPSSKNEKNFSIPNGITKLCSMAFEGCENLVDVICPDSIEIIEQAVFLGCNNILNIKLPLKLKTLNIATFCYCSNLNSISLPKSIHQICKNSFCEANKLKEVYYEGSKENWDSIEIGDGNNCLLNANIHYNSSYPYTTTQLSFYSSSLSSGNIGETKSSLLVLDSDKFEISDVDLESSDNNIVDIDAISIGEGNYITQENEKIATIYLKLKSEGTATITATSPDGTTASCIVTVTDKSSGFIKDFDKDMYAADQLTNNPDDYNLNYYLNEFKDPSRIIVDALRANKSFKSSVTKWKVTTEFLDANIDFVVDDELDAISYYEAIIFSVCQQTLEDTKFVDTYISSEEVKKLKLINSINSWIKNYEATDIKFDTTLSDTRKEALAKSLNQEYGYNDISKAVVNVLDYSKDINEFYNTISKYEAISDTTGKLVPMLKSIRRTSTNSALNTALDRVIKSIESQYGKMMTAIEVGTYKIYQWEVDEVTDMILDELIMSNPYVRAIKIGGAIGKSISNFAFSTDKNIEQFFAMAYLGYFQDCLKVAVSESQLNYKLDRCSENAQQLLFSLNSLFAAYNLGCEYAKEYGEIIYEKPLIYNTFIGKKFYGNSDTYSKYKENVSSIQTSLSLELNTINKYWAYKLLDDCPSLFDKIAQKIQLYRIGSIENASIRLSGLNFKYTGNHIEPKVNIFANNEVLEQGKDFSVEYKNNKEIGIASVIITSHNVRYPGTVTKHFMISDDNFVTEYNIRDNGRPESTRLFSQSNTKTKYSTGASDKIYGLSVNVYDGENLVAEIVDGEIVSNDIPIIINGNELTILMTDRNYSVVYFTSDSRDIDVTISKIGEEKEITDSTYYNDIIIQRNDECIHNISYDNDNIVSEMKIGDYEIECSDRPKENRDSPVTDPTEPATTESNEETTVTEPTESQTTETSESETTEPTEPISDNQSETQLVTDKPTDLIQPVTDKPTEPQTDNPSDPVVTQPATKTPTQSATEAPKTTSKKPNPIKVTVKKKTVKLKKLKKKAQKVKAITVKSAQGKVTYTLVAKGITKKIRKLVKINSKGVITIKRWEKAKKGTYIIKVKITAKGNTNYNLKTITKTVKIKIK